MFHLIYLIAVQDSGINILLLGGTTFLLTYHFVSKGFEENIQKELLLTANSVQTVLDDWKEKAAIISFALASRPDVAQAIQAKDTPYLQKVAKGAIEKQKIGLITIADQNGNVVARGHSDKAGDSIANHLNVKKALAGDASTGIEEGTVVKFSLRAGCPVKAGGKVVGSVTAGMDLSSDYAFVDEIKRKFGLECTIFHNDTRVMTTLIKDGQRIVGSRMDNPEVIKTVLEKGQRFVRQNTIMGKPYNTAYWPIYNREGKISGMLFIGKSLEGVMASYQAMFLAVLISILSMGFLQILGAFFFYRSIANPLTKIKDLLGKGAQQVATASNQVSSASQSLAEGASEQAAGLEETSASMEEMASMTKKNVENAHLGRMPKTLLWPGR